MAQDTTDSEIKIASGLWLIVSPEYVHHYHFEFIEVNRCDF